MLWLTLISTPMMAVIQGMCARIAMVSGQGLAAIMRKRMPRPLVYALATIVVIANTFNIGADIGGMGAAANIVVPHVRGEIWTVLFGVGLIIAQIRFSFEQIARICKVLTLALFAYVVTAFVVHPPWAYVLKHLVIPEIHLDSGWLATMVGVLGTTITPYLFFWQASLMVEEEKSVGRKTIKSRRGTTAEAVSDAHADINTGMIYSNAVAFFIIVTTAATLGAHGKHGIQTAQQAAEALRPLAGNAAALLFTLGMVGTGLLAVPVLACSSAYVVSETFRFREGLSERFMRAPQFYIVIIVGIVIGVAIDLLRIDPIKALFWSAVLNGVAAVPLLAAIVWLASDKRVMGQWRSSLVARVWGWATVVLMTCASAGMFYFMARGT
jgi:Mn2+/Fe2+ NRAMP family transporter